MDEQLTIAWHQRQEDAKQEPGQRYDMPLIRPTMIFASSWRCGSTMLQRMLIAGLKDCVIWGEPWEEYEFHRTMMEQFLQHSDVHHRLTQTRPSPTRLPFSQTANMNPGFAQLRMVHQEFWQNLLWNRQADHTNFGVKWVHADAEVLEYFKYLFPCLRPLVLVRNPFDALASYMTAIGEAGIGWCRSRRDHLWITSPRQFLVEWYRMAQSFEDIQGEAQAKSNWGEFRVFKYEGFLRPDGQSWLDLGKYVPELNLDLARLAQAYRVNYTSRAVAPRYQVQGSDRKWFLSKYPSIPFYERELRAT